MFNQHKGTKFAVILPVMRRCHVVSCSLLETLRVIQHHVGVGVAASGEGGREETILSLHPLAFLDLLLTKRS